MCVCPISIKNNKLDFDPLVDRLYNYVPCGKCYECQESKRNEFEVRSLYEYIHTKSIGGCAFYVTLTYNDSCVPKLPSTNLMVASKSDIQKFIKRLRKYLFDYKIKYYFVSEFGEKNHRPHYHGVIYFDKLINSDFFNSIVNLCWKFGFTCFGENKGLIRDARVFNYVSKYVCKDTNYVKYLNSLDNKFVKSYFDNDVKFRSKFSLFPFHLNSQHFGLSIIDLLKDTDYIKGYFVRSDIIGYNRKMAIPLYILRYKLYDKVQNSNGSFSYILNDYGVHIFKLKMKYQYDKLCQTYNDIVKLVLKGDLSFFQMCKSAHSKFTYSGFMNYFRSLSVSGANYIVAYKLLYHDINYVQFSFEDFNEDVQILIDTVYKKRWYQFSTGKKFLCPFSDEIKFEVRIFEEIISYLRYKDYVKRVNDYNRMQYHKSLKTKQIKLKPVLTYDEFINNVSSLAKYKCLTIKEDSNDLDSFLLDSLSREFSEMHLMAL